MLMKSEEEEFATEPPLPGLPQLSGDTRQSRKVGIPGGRAPPSLHIQNTEYEMPEERSILL